MNWTIAGIIAIALGVILVWSVLVKKFPQLKLIDLSTLSKERQAEAKTRIIHERFDRSLKAIEKKSGAAMAGVASGLRGWYRQLYGKLKAIEGAPPEASVGTLTEELAATAGESAPAVNASELVVRASEAMGEGRLDEAETLLIEALKADARDLSAYRGLAALYVAGRLYDQARETLEYAIRLRGDEGVGHDVRADLGAIYMEMGLPAKAHEQFRLALESEPYNPRYLDYYLEASILIGDAAAAEGAFEVLETANPENRKLADFRERIDALAEMSQEPA